MMLGLSAGFLLTRMLASLAVWITRQINSISSASHACYSAVAILASSLHRCANEVDPINALRALRYRQRYPRIRQMFREFSS